MTRIAKEIVALTILALLFLPTLEAANKPKDSSATTHSITIWQARRTVAAGLFNPCFRFFDSGSFRFDIDSFEFDATLQGRKKGEHFSVDLKRLQPVVAICKSQKSSLYRLKDETGRDLPYPLSDLYFWAQSDAERFVAALNSLRAFANDAEAPLRFTQQAAAWRALSSKPPIPEEIRTRRLLAEDAIQEKKPEEALSHYENGLDLYPTWPQGRFNAALIAAELGYFAEAVEHMQAYLELVPDASDAQSARDQIAIWQYKAIQQTNGESSNKSHQP